VPIVLKYGSLSLLETSGLVQACNGIALPLHAFRVDIFGHRLFSEVTNKNKGTFEGFANKIRKISLVGFAMSVCH